MSTTSSTCPSSEPSRGPSANRSARPSSDPRNDRAALCTFTFSDGRQCRTPRRQGHPYLCFFHAKKEAQALAGEQAAQDIASFLTSDYLSACDLASALARLFSAVAHGHIKPKTAATLAYLGQTLVQTLRLAQHEYINAFGSNAWRSTIRSSFPPPDPPPPPPQSPAPPSPCGGAPCSGGPLGPSAAPPTPPQSHSVAANPPGTPPLPQPHAPFPQPPNRPQPTPFQPAPWSGGPLGPSAAPPTPTPPSAQPAANSSAGTPPPPAISSGGIATPNRPFFSRAGRNRRIRLHHYGLT